MFKQIGETAKTSSEELLKYDPNCYLCPNNKRVGGTIQNEDYKDTFVFVNDFSALLPPKEGESNSKNELNKESGSSLFRSQKTFGECRGNVSQSFFVFFFPKIIQKKDG